MDDAVSLPTIYASNVDGIAMVSEPPANITRPKFMNFAKGSWLLGAERTPVPVGTKLILHGAGQGWERIARGELPQRIARETGKAFPSRDALGDTDQSAWPLFDGKPSDPWSLANELLLTAVDTGQPIVFSTRSWSGREAVEDLCRLVTHQRRQRGDAAKPIITIGSATRTSKHGPYAVPAFTIAGWIDANEVSSPPPSKLSTDLSAHLAASSTIPGNATTTAPLPQPRRRRKKASPAPWDDLDDEIPETLG